MEARRQRSARSPLGNGEEHARVAELQLGHAADQKLTALAQKHDPRQNQNASSGPIGEYNFPASTSRRRSRYPPGPAQLGGRASFASIVGKEGAVRELPFGQAQPLALAQD